MPQPTIGRVVHYTLSEHDAESINRRRTDFHESRSADSRTGFVGHVGNHAEAGDVYPATVVRVWDETQVTVNLQVHLDGTDTYWATSRAEGDQPGHWSWPPRV
ncbi:hypothetical protein [Streptomyces sp. NPDC006527]|jgi:hypothetical protein|uniref:hypothetical protein n=1 Tax=Streptomyces sp. NPDC006527 TaxID=3364749 RepID=UPI0036B141E1